MYKLFYFTIIFSLLIALLGFAITPSQPVSYQVKKEYMAGLDTFINQVHLLKKALVKGKTEDLQPQFFKMRECYKKIEVFVEYFFDNYATVLNGPPIPFYDEKEPYKLENTPMGMQVIEGFIFPTYDSKNYKNIEFQVDELIRQVEALPNVIEPFAFDDANIFDAFIEEVYRITALGITGFDSQTAQHSLPECVAALKGLQQFLLHYELSFNERLPQRFKALNLLITEACVFIQKNNNFNKFDRLTFIITYLNPIAKLIGDYKTAYQLIDNPAGNYYSSIKKNNTLFAENAFNPYRFLDDYTTTPQKVELGRQLFFEPQLSSTNKQSCASCHQPNKAFTDGLKTSTALDGHSPLKRNAPTLWNAALQRSLFVDSRSKNLEDQILQVLNNADEMHGSAKTVAEKILRIEKYKNLYENAYPDAKVDGMVSNICNAIASYERTLIALNSRFDKHMNGITILSKKEINGFNLFMGKAKCGSCHFMPLFSGAKPPRYYYIESEVLGVPTNTNKRKPTLDNDSGRYLTTQLDIHLFSFKTPTLRNVALTSPYMHNGVFSTLEEVMDFYNNGGGKGLRIAPTNQTLPFEKLGLSQQDKKDIILFMKALTDTIPKHIGTN